MYRALVLAVLLVVSGHGASLACSPPAPASMVEGPAGTLVPFHDAGYLALVGEVVGHGTGEHGAPALRVQVLDPWTDRQQAGEVVSIAARQWQGCGLPWPMGERFDPGLYPVGTRVRIVSREPVMFSWDVPSGITVLEQAR